MNPCRHLACDRPAGHFGDGQLCRSCAARLGIPVDHGTRSRYVRHRCRCAACVKANSSYHPQWVRTVRRLRRERAGLVDASATIARIRVLKESGWTHEDIVRGACVSNGAVSALARGLHARVRQSTADRIAALYERDATTRRAA